MSSVNRIPSLLEQSVRSNAAGPTVTNAILNNLGAASNSSLISVSGNVLNISSQITQLSGNSISQTIQIAELSGNSISQASQIANISGGLATAGVPRSEVTAVSAGLYTDIQNLDLSLTEKIAVDCIQSDRITGASTTVVGYITVNISGAEYKLALIQ
jgi:hypothetical protein